MVPIIDDKVVRHCFCLSYLSQCRLIGSHRSIKRLRTRDLRVDQDWPKNPIAVIGSDLGVIPVEAILVL